LAFTAGFAAGFTAGLTGAAAMVFLGSALGAAAFALVSGFAVTLTGFAAVATVFLISGLAAGAALDFFDGETGTGELTLDMDFLGTALDTATGVALALAVMDFLSGTALFALAGTIGLEAFEVLLLAFVGEVLLTFLLIFALFFAIDLTSTGFLAGVTGFFAATTFFGLVLALAFAWVSGAFFALLVKATFFTDAATLVLAALFEATLASGFAAALTGLAITGLAAKGLALVGGAFFTGSAFFATGFLAAGLDAFVFFGVGMVQPSVLKWIGWRQQHSHALLIKRRPLNDRTETWGQAVWANIWVAALAVGRPR
jgi:hypothetical protein